MHSSRQTPRPARIQQGVAGPVKSNCADFERLNQKEYGVVQGLTDKLKVNFTDNLLLEATPVESSMAQAIY
jgi:hypothetical protein